VAAHLDRADDADWRGHREGRTGVLTLSFTGRSCPQDQQPSDPAYAKLNQYLRTGGMILFDTRDADLAGFGGTTAEGQALQLIASGLDIPPLEQMPPTMC
jgi:hypothetical protein